MIRDLLHRVVSHPGVYDRVQELAGVREIQRRVAPFLALAEGTVLDVGGGTGNFRELTPRAARYVLIDLDTEKVAGFTRKYPDGTALVGDGTSLCLGNASVDTALCVAVSHHLDDGQLHALFAEAARVAVNRVVFVDAVRTDRPVSRLLWRYDRGSHPRDAAVLEDAMRSRFALEHVERFTVYHTYLLMVGAPNRP
jgi:SAM-dependent methyltransferase